MKTNVHLLFPGTCREAFNFYAKTFNTKPTLTLTFGEAPAGTPVPPDAKDLIMHTSMPLGTVDLMGCDTPKGREDALGGFQISVSVDSEDEVRRLFKELSHDGVVQMEPIPTFWSPLFSMCKDRFGVGWMIGIPGQTSPAQA